MEEDFHSLSLFQKMQFLHDLMSRVKDQLPTRQNNFIGVESASSRELLKDLTFFRCLGFAMAPEQAHKMKLIYRSITPGKSISIPDRLRCKSVLIMLLVHLLNHYHPALDLDRITRIAREGLEIFGAINRVEGDRLGEAFSFNEENRTLYFEYEEQKYRCVLNTRNGYGYELNRMV